MVNLDLTLLAFLPNGVCICPGWPLHRGFDINSMVAAARSRAMSKSHTLLAPCELGLSLGQRLHLTLWACWPRMASPHQSALPLVDSGLQRGVGLGWPSSGVIDDGLW